jgi:hypothetical protein
MIHDVYQSPASIHSAFPPPVAYRPPTDFASHGHENGTDPADATVLIHKGLLGPAVLTEIGEAVNQILLNAHALLPSIYSQALQ